MESYTKYLNNVVEYRYKQNSNFFFRSYIVEQWAYFKLDDFKVISHNEFYSFQEGLKQICINLHQTITFRFTRISFLLYKNWPFPQCGPTLAPGIMIWIHWNLPYLKILLRKLHKQHKKKIIKEFSLCTPILKFDPFLWTHSTPRDHDLNKYVSFSG